MSLGDLIKQHSVKSIQAMKLPELMEAEVVSDPPDLKIKLKGSDKLIIPKELIVVAERLCRVKRKVNLTNSGATTIGAQTFSGNTENSPTFAHVHPYSVEVSLKDRDFTLKEGEIHYINDDKKDDLLKKGDKVMVITFEGGQKFFIFDRMVTY
ncbi:MULTISPECIES: DUF2577 family protein [Paenibacillus]|uniref:DUF2577 domain-containing protein n=1 Tax=Paenibacillus glycanilyticus TaxID=126569 RepID=A0ABQ6NHT9_9BACL|nr:MULTISPECIES: DUF2577 family protein [Paenibacillus]MCK9858835.1 DUF2577 domain-containing protein [Paenibacillus sp. ATY16]GMK44029.1 hypothetical protein PghCCS26_11560 [Paenibacillus glycanilyticus]